MDRKRIGKGLLVAAFVAVMLASWWGQEQRQRAAAGLVQRVGEAATLLQKCRQGDAGSAASALADLARLAAAPDAPLAVKQAHDACVAHTRR